MVKNLPANAGDAGRQGFNPWVGKIALEKEMATHSQNCCLEHPMDRGAWRATVHGVAQSQIQLKQLSTQACIFYKTAVPKKYPM